MKRFTTQIDKTRGKPDTATSCKSGFGASIWKPSVVIRQGAGYLAYSDKLRQTIDEMLAQKPKNFDAFLQLMQGAGYEIKSGKHYAFKGAEQKKFIRLRSLGEGYSEDEIKAVIEGKAPQREVKKTAAKQPKRQGKSVNLLVDIQAKLQQGKSKGYEQWAKIGENQTRLHR